MTIFSWCGAMFLLLLARWGAVSDSMADLFGGLLFWLLLPPVIISGDEFEVHLLGQVVPPCVIVNDSASSLTDVAPSWEYSVKNRWEPQSFSMIHLPHEKTPTALCARASALYSHAFDSRSNAFIDYSI